MRGQTPLHQDPRLLFLEVEVDWILSRVAEEYAAGKMTGGGRAARVGLARRPCRRCLKTYLEADALGQSSNSDGWYGLRSARSS